MSGEAGVLARRNSDDKRMTPRKKKRGHEPFSARALWVVRSTSAYSGESALLLGTAPSPRPSSKYGR